MGSWFSKKDNHVEDEAKAIIQSADSPIIQLNWATFSTGLSSVAIILVLLLMLAICYKKNRRSNRRARRAELHDILHSLHRGPPSNSAPPPARGGYPGFPPAFQGAYPGLPMQMASMAPVVSYPGPQSTSTAIVPAGQMLQVLQRPIANTFVAPIDNEPAVPASQVPPAIQRLAAYGAHNAPQRTGFPGVNSGVNRRAQLRARYGSDAARQRRLAPQPPTIALPAPGQQTDDTTTEQASSNLKAITYVPIPREPPLVPLGRAKSLANIYPGSFPVDSVPRMYKARSAFFADV